MSLSDFTRRLEEQLWKIERRRLPRWQAEGVYLVQVLYATGREIVGGLTGLRAMGLVYTTLLSIVPLLAFSFSVLKGFGVHNKLEPVLLGFFEPLGAKGAEIARAIVGFVDNVEVGVLGALGLALLLYTVVSLLKKIEMAFNYTWRVSEYRSMTQRVSNFLSVALIGPLLVFSALGITATVSRLDAVVWIQNLPAFALALEYAGRLVPYVLIIAAFTFIYVLVPNTRVKLRSALTGGIIAGVLWESTSWAFSSFVVLSSTRTAIYSSFAILFIFMIWLYLNWLILLTGSTIAFYHQHPERLTAHQHTLRLSCRLREKLALLIMLRIAQSFDGDGRRWTQERLARNIGVPVDAVAMVLAGLEARRLVTYSGDKRPRLLPARSPDRIEVREVLQAIRMAHESRYLDPGELRSDAALEELLALNERAVTEALGKSTLRDLAERSAAGEAAPEGSGPPLAELVTHSKAGRGAGER